MLLALLQFSEDGERRDGRGEAILASLEPSASARQLEVGEERPSASDNALGGQFIDNPGRREAAVKGWKRIRT
jgi:hypothetical protein